MMKQTNTFRAAEIDSINAKAIEMPYKGNQATTLYLLILT